MCAFEGGADLAHDTFWPEGDFRFPAELYSQATFNQPRTEPSFLRRCHRGAATLAPFDMQAPSAGHVFDAPTHCHASGVDRQGSIFQRVGCEFVHGHNQRSALAAADLYLGPAERDAVRSIRPSIGLQCLVDELMEERAVTIASGQHILSECHRFQPGRERFQ